MATTLKAIWQMPKGLRTHEGEGEAPGEREAGLRSLRMRRTSESGMEKRGHPRPRRQNEE